MANVDIEKAVLAVLLRRGGGDELITLKAEYFQHANHRRAFETMKKLYLESHPIDVVTLGQELKNASYAVDLDAYADLMLCTQQELEQLIEKLQQKYIRTELMKMAKDVYKALAAGKDVDEVKAEIMMCLENIEVPKDRGPIPMSEAIILTMEWLEKQYKLHEEEKLLTTHLPDLNDMIGGLMPQDLIIIAARPSVGKTALSLDIAKHVAAKGHTVLFVSLEMNVQSLVARYLASMTSIDIQSIRTGKLKDEDWTKFTRAIGPMSKWTLYFDDTSSTVSQIKVKAKELRAKKCCDLIIIDYMQLLKPEGRHDTREQEVASISRSLKNLAKELDIPVIVLAQLNREAEGRRPTLAHLRESGAQEQDADLIIFLWEPPEDELKGKWQEVKRNLNQQSNRLIELIVGKQRNGQTGAFYLCYLPAKNKFVCLSDRGETDEVDRNEQKQKGDRSDKQHNQSDS